VVLYLMTSWTGARIAEGKIQADGGAAAGDRIHGKGEEGGEGNCGGRITGVVWESSEEAIRGMDEGIAKERVRGGGVSVGFGGRAGG
jgi:hypothetical protein